MGKSTLSTGGVGGGGWKGRGWIIEPSYHVF